MDEVFDARQAEGYEQWLLTPAGQAYLAAGNALLDRVLDCHPGWRVLDVGCGAGVHLARLAERGVLPYGLEAGPVMARAAAEKLGRQAEIQVGDAHDLPYEDNTFDAVIMVNTLELVDRPAQAVAEAARVAISRVCLISINPWSLGGLALWLYRRKHPLHLRRQLSLWGLRRLIREVLGPVPQRWAGAGFLPGFRTRLGPPPLGSLVAVSAAVTPRYITRPLEVTSGRPAARAIQPAHSAGRITVLQRVK
jgi:SAM-dependent methyltransferase